MILYDLAIAFIYFEWYQKRMAINTFKYNNWLDQCDLKKLKGILFKFNKWFDQCKRKKTKTYFQVQCERNQRNQRS